MDKGFLACPGGDPQPSAAACGERSRLDMSMIADAWGAWSDALDEPGTDVRSLFSE